MLNKSKSRPAQLVKYALLIPVVFGMLFFVACSENSENQSEASQSTSIDQVRNLIESMDSGKKLSDSDKEKLSKYLLNEIRQSINNGSIDKMQTFNKNEVPFADIDEPPVFPGCESLTTLKEKKSCFGQKIAEFVNTNFNTKLGKELGLKGRQRIIVFFKIGDDGTIADVKARAPHPELEKEAIRVIKLLPKVQPGTQKGVNVTVPYSLPIIFQVSE